VYAKHTRTIHYALTSPFSFAPIPARRAGFYFGFIVIRRKKVFRPHFSPLGNIIITMESGATRPGHPQNPLETIDFSAFVFVLFCTDFIFSCVQKIRNLFTVARVFPVCVFCYGPRQRTACYLYIKYR